MVDPVRVTLEYLHHLPRWHVRKADHSVPGPRQQLFPRLVEFQRADIRPMTLKNAKALTGAHIPKANASIEGARSHPPLIVGPGQRRNRFFVPGKRVKAIPGFDIPDMNLGICTIASSQQARAIRTIPYPKRDGEALAAPDANTQRKPIWSAQPKDYQQNMLDSVADHLLRFTSET
jgi:hypothetical protein